ncbi:asparaginase [Roseicitreum antarcticum]|nr:asparaginase [Roseicitreum antarcticum]
MIEVLRGGQVESVHTGHAVICGPDGEIVAAWGDPSAVIYPRSSCKMLQALPLLESGAADALTPAHLALACASHSGGAIHTDLAGRWLADLGLSEGDLLCGCQEPSDRSARNGLIRSDAAPCQLHNNCSGKHVGFLMLNQRLGGGADYVDPAHPVQRAILQAFEDITQEASPWFGIDGCSAPNFATSVTGLARAMASFAAADSEGNARERAAVRLHRAMAAHPDLVAGQGRACTDLMRAMDGQAAIKFGAEAVYVAILPGQKLGIALKIVDGGVRAAEAAITALLIRAGVLDAAHPAALARLGGEMRNWRGISVGQIRTAAGFA